VPDPGWTRLRPVWVWLGAGPNKSLGGCRGRAWFVQMPGRPDPLREGFGRSGVPGDRAPPAYPFPAMPDAGRIPAAMRGSGWDPSEPTG
jgi:hypothetical protein